MCGLVGIINKNKSVTNDVLKILSFLEYRGYDSISFFYQKQNKLYDVKSLNRVDDLKTKCRKIEVNIGAGHTRWATHGEVSLENTHPHYDNSHSFSLAHNGIIDNYEEIKNFLITKGYFFSSSTDSEVISNLIHYYYTLTQNVLTSIYSIAQTLKGSYALIILKNDEKRIYFIKKDSPLYLIKENSYHILTSDVNAISYLTNSYYLLDNNDYGYLDYDEFKIFNNLKEVKKEKRELLLNNYLYDKKGLKHYMLKEIYEEIPLIDNILNNYFKNKKIVIDDLMNYSINIIACGSSYNVSRVVKYLYKKLANKIVNIYLASEFVYEEEENPLYIFLSQSGETIDVINCFKNIKKGEKVCFTSSLNSSLALMSDKTYLLHIGSEIAVAASKSYISMLIILLLPLFKYLKRDEEYFEFLKSLKNDYQKIFDNQVYLNKISNYLLNFKEIYFLGRNVDYAIAKEASLKLKEITYLNSDEFYCGELKHGPIALISSESLAIFLNFNEETKFKTLANIKEVEARRGTSLNFSTSLFLNEFNIVLDKNLYPLQVMPLFQLLSYKVALLKGLDIDKPRNLAKSVTVI